MTGSELLVVGAAARGIEALITDTTKTGSSNVIANTIKGLKDKSSQAIFTASRKYVENYQKRHCQLKVLGMREPVDLSTVYTGVKLLSDRDILQFDPDALEKTFRGNRLRGYSGSSRKNEKKSGLTIANQKQYLMVLGGPGAGKSTFIRKVGLEALRTFYYEKVEYRHRLIPVLLELKRFEKDNVDVEKFIAAEFETCGFPEAAAFAQNALVQGNLLILLDGLDEIPSANLNNVLNIIRDFVDLYDQNRFISSCRVAASGYRGSAFQRFSNVTMADFDDEQIQQFIGNWFSDELDTERKTAEKCWEVLQKNENKASKELAHTPLLLTYLCLVYGGSQRFPDNRSSLYRKALRILLEEWAAEKRILRDDIYEGLSVEQEEILLAEIAYDGMENDQLFFDKRWLSTQIREFLVGNVNAPKTLSSEKVLAAIEVQQGILVQRMEDQYSFSHLTLQEYLTAQYLVDNNDWISLVQDHITENRWREIFLLLPGLMSGRTGADDLLLAMKKQADSCFESPQLKALVQWADNAVEKSKPTANKTFAVCLAMTLARARARARALDLARALDRDLSRALDRALDLDRSLARDLSHALDRALDLDRSRSLALALARARALDLDRSRSRSRALARDLSRLNVFSNVDFDGLLQSLEQLKSNKPGKVALREENAAFVEEVYGTWFSALGIETAVAVLSVEDVQSIADYFYICELIIRCKEGATRVSPDVWESIESSILTVPVSSDS